MMEQRRTALKELQQLDMQVHEARQQIHDFDPLFEEVEEPALTLESELGASRKRLKEMKLEERQLESSTAEKRDRQKRLDERLSSVRNLREEAAVTAELEMVKRALQNDEQEALNLMDQIRKVEERVAEVETAFAEASEVVEPKRNDLLAKRAEAQLSLESLERQRESFAGGMKPAELKIYSAIRGDGRRAAVAELTEDGACGNCFGVVPLQLQNEVRHGDSLIRCEGCGVILAAPEPVQEGAAEAAPDTTEAEEAVVSEDTDADDSEVADDGAAAAEEAEEE